MQLKIIFIAFIVLVALCFSSARKKSHIKNLVRPAFFKTRPGHHHSPHHYFHREKHLRRPHEKAHVHVHNGTTPIKAKHVSSKAVPSPPKRHHSKAATRTTSSPSSTPVSSSLIDVGKVAVTSITKTCNGVLLNPSLVLTSATCVYADRKSDSYEDIEFTLNGVTKEVKSVQANPQWRLTSDRANDFALLRLAQPMSNVADRPTRLTWSPYALEDIGESFLAKPSPVSCTTASSKATGNDVIRLLNNEIITVACSGAGGTPSGSPFYRLVDNQPVVYGVYFGMCTSGSLDRKVTGSCGARITKQEFMNLCQMAKNEGIDLADCGSTSLNIMDPTTPTLVTTPEAYEEVKSTEFNLKAAMLIYFPASSKLFSHLLNDIEIIQRLKLVYDKFQVALVDSEALKYDLPYAPFIEFRTAGSQTFLPYNDDFSLDHFKTFMKEFSRVGAPPTGTTSFVQLALSHHDKRSLLGKRLNPVQSASVKVTKRPRLTCDDNGFAITDITSSETCVCDPGFVGDGTVGNCEDELEAIKANCKFSVQAKDDAESSAAKVTYDQFVQTSESGSICESKFIFSYLQEDAESVNVAGVELTPDDCSDYIAENVLSDCEDGEEGSLLHFKHNSLRRFLHTHEHTEHRRNKTESLHRHKRTVTDISMAPPANYLQNFLDDDPPSNIPVTSDNYYIYQDWVPTATNKFSTYFNAKRGIAEYTGYKLSHAQLGQLNAGTTTNRALISTSWKTDPALKPDGTILQGKNNIYAGRGDKKKYKNGVDKGHLNPSHINAFDGATMKLTHIHTNAYPQFTRFNIGDWKKYEGKIYNYAKTRCYNKGANSEFHLLTGLSDYQIIGGRKMAMKKPEIFWPVHNNGAPQPAGSKPLRKNAYSIVQAWSMWTVGCCTWDQAGATKAESISVWANNVYTPFTKLRQPTLDSLSKAIYPGKKVKFFPGNLDCEDSLLHYTLP